jgi:hypothetical protein
VQKGNQESARKKYFVGDDQARGEGTSRSKQNLSHVKQEREAGKGGVQGRLANRGRRACKRSIQAGRKDRREEQLWALHERIAR